jgi:hypothetical protein
MTKKKSAAKKAATVTAPEPATVAPASHTAKQHIRNTLNAKRQAVLDNIKANRQKFNAGDIRANYKEEWNALAGLPPNAEVAAEKKISVVVVMQDAIAKLQGLFRYGKLKAEDFN